MALQGPAWDQGRAGEAAIKRWLQQQGFYVLPAADIENGGSPALEGLHSRAVLPDLLAAARGRSRFVEVKTKSHATLYRASGVYEHGIGLKHWYDYLACQEQTGIPCYLCIWELESQLVLLQALDKLEAHGRIYNGSNMPGGKPHIFFPREAFDPHQGPGQGAISFTPITPLAPRTLSQPHIAGFQQPLEGRQ